MAPAPAQVPCGSCPYRCDVPSGIWDQCEYDKLPEYDGETWQQSPAVFLCHQRDGRLCSGWLACHGAEELLALRFPGAAHPSAFSYKTNVPVFSSGADARRHGMRDISQPNSKAEKMIAGLIRARAPTGEALMPRDQWTFNDWKANYAHRIKLMGGIKTMEATLEMLPDDMILASIWREGTDPNDAAMDELATWDE